MYTSINVCFLWMTFLQFALQYRLISIVTYQNNSKNLSSLFQFLLALLDCYPVYTLLWLVYTSGTIVGRIRFKSPVQTGYVLAELMKSKFVRRPSFVVGLPSYCGINYSEPIGWISFKFRFLLALCRYARMLLNLWKKKRFFGSLVTNIFPFLLTWDAMGAKISKRYLSLK